MADTTREGGLGIRSGSTHLPAEYRRSRRGAACRTRTDDLLKTARSDHPTTEPQCSQRFREYTPRSQAVRV